MSFSSYSDRQKSAIPGLGDVPVHWELKRLKDVASHNDEALGDDTPEEAEFLYVDISSVNTLQGIHTKEDVVFKNAPSRARRRIQDGDVIVSTVRTYLKAIARVIEPEENLIVSTGFAVVRPGEQLDPIYAGFLLLSNYFIDEVISRSTGVSYPAINASELVRIHVPVPPLEEQQAIATFLDTETSKIDALVAEQRRLIELLKEKRQAVISHAVTKGLNPDVPMKPSGIEWLGDVPEHWETKKLGWVLRESPKNGASPQISGDGGTPTFSIAAVRNGTTNIRDHIKYVDISLEDAGPYLVRKNDILVLRGNGNKALVGTAGIVADVPPENCIYPDILIRIRPSDCLLPWYLVTVLNSSSMRPSVEMAAQTASGVWKISGKSLQDLRLPVPPVDEQNAIQAECEKRNADLDELQAEAERAVELLQERRTALISAAVTGKIDVRRFACQETA